MSNALAAESPKAIEAIPTTTAVSFVAGMALVGALSGIALTSKKSSAWVYGGVGAGFLIGGSIGIIGAKFIVGRAVARLRAEAAAKAASEGQTA